tara:strand:- start:4508 stop:4909 length:402 start_codon:yes stop_codon:yes gene_type:complete
MGRITKVTGEFMGVRFEVKPTPIRFDKVSEERRQMLLGWYKEHHPKLHKKLIDDKYSAEDYTMEDLEGLNTWRLDEDFRAEYCEFTAKHCMKLDKPIDKKTWKSDDLELGTLEEAWDFFTNRRQVPTSGVVAL